MCQDRLLGPQGIILGHNMYAYTQNTPVMYTDYSGFAPQWWENVKNWWNSTPTSDFTIPSFDDATGAIFNMLGGVLINPVVAKTTERLLRPFHMWDFKGLTKATNQVAKFAGRAMIIVPLSFDIGNTITENNGNTVGQRFTKGGVQLLSCGINVAAGYFGATLIVAGVATTPILIGFPIAAAGVGVIYGGYLASELLEEKAYEYFDIK